MTKFLFVSLLVTLSLASLRSQETILDFSSSRGWEKGEHHIRPARVNERKTLLLDFGDSEQRIVARKNGTWDLSHLNAFRFRVGIDQTTPLLEATLSFKSGNGWYRRGFTLSEKGFHHLFMSKAEFSSEGTPIGWDQIDAVELSFWPRKRGVVHIRPAALEGLVASVQILDTESLAENGDEVYTARVSKRHQQRIFSGLGVPTALVQPKELTTSSPPELLIIPSAPRIPIEVTNIIANWIRSGTSLLVFGCQDPLVANFLGVELGPTLSSRTVGKYDRMKSLPNSSSVRGEVFQHTWTFRNAWASQESKTLATWVDAEGHDHAVPAVIGSPRGVWVTAEWKSGDLRAKQNWMAQWIETYSETALNQSEMFFKETKHPDQLVLRASSPAPTSPAAISLKNRALQLAEQAEATEEVNRSYALRRKSAAFMERSIASGTPSWSAQVKGIWDQQGTGFYAGGWDETAKRLHEAGFNTIFANMATAGRAHYASSMIPPSKTLETYGDQLQAFTRAAKKYGLQAHAWKICWKLNTREASFRKRLEEEGRLMQDPEGNTIPWLSLSDPRNVEFEIQSLLEMARAGSLDGIHLDYMRYPGAQADYGPAARKKFETQLGRSLPNWPAEVMTSLQDEFQVFRQQEVHNAMQKISAAVRAEFPDLVLSVAVWGAWPDCAVNQAQDWPVWCRNGWVDWIIPMNYTDNRDQFAGWLDLQRKQPGVAERLLPGIGLISTNAELTPLQLLDQLEEIRKRNLKGAVLYRLDSSLPNRTFPYLKVWK